MPILQADYTTLNHEEMASAIGLKAKHVPMLIGSYLEEAGPILEKLQTAIEEKDFDALRAAAHSLKGSSGNLHFNELYDMAKEMEYAANEADDSFAYSDYLNTIKSIIATIPA